MKPIHGHQPLLPPPHHRQLLITQKSKTKSKSPLILTIIIIIPQKKIRKKKFLSSGNSLVFEKSTSSQGRSHSYKTYSQPLQVFNPSSLYFKFWTHRETERTEEEEEEEKLRKLKVGIVTFWNGRSIIFIVEVVRFVWTSEKRAKSEDLIVDGRSRRRRWWLSVCETMKPLWSCGGWSIVRFSCSQCEEPLIQAQGTDPNESLFWVEVAEWAFLWCSLPSSVHVVDMICQTEWWRIQGKWNPLW